MMIILIPDDVDSGSDSQSSSEISSLSSVDVSNEADAEIEIYDYYGIFDERLFKQVCR